MPQSLNERALAALQSSPLSRKVILPSYARGGPIGVVHLGLGAFHRAHQALVFDALLAGGDARWGVLGVGMRNPQLADTLAAQDGLYSVQIANHEGSHWQIGGAIWRTCVAAREPLQVVHAMAAPCTRWVTLTVTEKAYDANLAALLVQGLAARQAAGLGGLTLASCDNLAHNGQVLRSLCLVHAQTHNTALADWIGTRCRFPNSMVDRIVPATTPARVAAARKALGLNDPTALGTEAFWEWVIERQFVDPSDAGALAAVGVTVVDDVQPYVEAKLRLLNGSHSALACIGALAGLATVSDCMAHAAIRNYLHRLMTDEVGPGLARPDWPAYRDALVLRFTNPALQHSVHQIATDSSQKIPQRWVPAINSALRAGRPVDHLAFAAACWMHYLRGQTDAGHSYPINDPMAKTLTALAQAHTNTPHAAVQALGKLPAIWGDALPHNPMWLARVTHWLTQIQLHGVLDALVQTNSDRTS